MAKADRAKARFFLDPFGCAKNQVDAEVIIASLLKAGYVRVMDPEDSDVIIVNSCGFIEPAKKEAINAVMDHKERWPGKKVILSGCLAERYAGELESTLPEADGFFGNSDPARAPEAVAEVLSGRRASVIPERGTLADGLGRTEFLSYPGSVYVKITEGCSNDCSYCAIPLIRGPLVSRAKESIVAEIRDLVSRGMREINLVGQDSGSYGMDLSGTSMTVELLRNISRVKGDFRVRTLYIHPDHFPQGILELCKEDPRILPYFDIPFQHASVPILRAMNRSGDPETYLKLIADIRAAFPDATVRSTFLTGFPGETESDHQAVLDFVGKAKLDWAGAFPYSREDGTKAFAMKGKVPKKTALGRKADIEGLQTKISEANLIRFPGRHERAIVEECVEGGDFWIGRIASQAPDVDGLTVIVTEDTLTPGEFVDVRITRVNGLDLEAVPERR